LKATYWSRSSAAVGIAPPTVSIAQYSPSASEENDSEASASTVLISATGTIVGGRSSRCCSDRRG
jgi:hypothetical protein